MSDQSSLADVLHSIETVEVYDVRETFERLPFVWRSDRSVVLAAARRDESILRCLPRNSELLSDRTVAIEALSSINCTYHDYGAASFQYMSPDLRADPELALLAVQRFGISWCYASDEIKQTRRDVALEAAKHDGRVLRDMPDIWKMDPEIVTGAIQSGSLDEGDWQLVPLNFRNNRDFVLAMIARSVDENVSRYVPHQFLADREFVKRVLEVAPWMLATLPPEMVDCELITTAIGQINHGQYLKSAPFKFRYDPAMIELAMKHGADPCLIWDADWHNMKERLGSLHATLYEICGETIVEDMYLGEYADAIPKRQRWMREKLETAWLVEGPMKLQGGPATDVCDFLDLPKVIGQFKELQLMEPVIRALNSCQFIDGHCDLSIPFRSKPFRDWL